MTMRSLSPHGLIQALVLPLALALGLALGFSAPQRAAADGTEAKAEESAIDASAGDAAANETTEAKTEEVKTEEGLAAEAAAANAEGEVDETPPVFTEEFLADTANIEAGREYWGELCVHCHGSKAYPGKAPKLKPARYKPEFVYNRITNGFRKMPSWKDTFDKEERMAIVAWVLSHEFSP